MKYLILVLLLASVLSAQQANSPSATLNVSYLSTSGGTNTAAIVQVSGTPGMPFWLLAGQGPPNYATPLFGCFGTLNLGLWGIWTPLTGVLDGAGNFWITYVPPVLGITDVSIQALVYDPNAASFCGCVLSAACHVVL